VLGTRYFRKEKRGEKVGETTKKEAELGLTRGHLVTFNHPVEILASPTCQSSCPAFGCPVSGSANFRKATFIGTIECPVIMPGQDKVLYVFVGMPVNQVGNSESFQFCLSRETLTEALA
jgi:hypothetical protein